VVLQEYSDTSKHRRYGEKTNQEYRSPILDAKRPPSQLLCVRIPDRENGEGRLRVMDTALCTVDRDLQVRSKEVVISFCDQTSFAGIRERTVRGDLTELQECRWGMKENRRKSWVC
jgi:hypothetical protein